MKLGQTRGLLPRYILCGVALACAAPLSCTNSAISGPALAAPDLKETHATKQMEEEPLVAPVDTKETISASEGASGVSIPEEETAHSAAGSATGGKPVLAAAGPGSEPMIPPSDYSRGRAPTSSTPSTESIEEEGTVGVGLGLSGVGEGGGGVGDVGVLGHGAGTGSGVGFGSGYGRLGGSHKSSGPAVRGGEASASGRSASVSGAPHGDQASRGVAAGEWDDNANFHEFRKFLSTQHDVPFTKLNLEKRRFLVVQDSKGQGVPNCAVTVRDGSGHSTRLTTGASGRVVLFPRAEGLFGKTLSATASCIGGEVSSQMDLAPNDGVVSLKLGGERALPALRTVDVAFVLDTTGSMSEEINQLKSTIMKVADTLGEAGVRVRLGMVEYRDRGDIFLTRVHQMTTDVNGFVGRVEAVRADGGGDQPEDVNEGLAVALSKLTWNKDSVARTAFLIGDAPPQIHYQDSTSYAESMKKAARDGIHVYTIAASGMEGLGQVVWRQIAQYTGGTNMFVLRGGAGPESVGGGDPKSSCGGTHTNYSVGNLDELIRSKVRFEISSLSADPLRIAGLFEDENVKPCDERVVMMDD